MRSIVAQWDTDSSGDETSSFVVSYCEDSPWDDAPRLCQSFLTNATEVRIEELRPSTKYLIQVEKLAEEYDKSRKGRILHPFDSTVNLPTPFNWRDRIIILDKASASSIETKKCTDQYKIADNFEYECICMMQEIRLT